MADCKWCDGRGSLFCECGKPKEPPKPVLVIPTPNPRKNVRTEDPVTSWLAAFEHPGFRHTLRRRVYLALKAAGWSGHTDDELSEVLDHRINSVNKRRQELRDWGLVVDSGRTRKTSSGSLAIVWVLAEFAKAKEQA